MLPFRDHNQSGSFPIVTIALIVLNILVFLFELSQQAIGNLDNFIQVWAIIPSELVRSPLTEFPTVFTAMFMHGGWLHLGGNMLYLWIFGDNIEDLLGKPLYIVFYFAAGIGATLLQVVTDVNSNIPNLGASGAIAGVLGGYLVMFPRARVDTLVTLGYFIRVIQLPAIAVLGFWIVLQFFSGVLSLGGAGSGVAYFAHIGGFVVGMAIMGLYRLVRSI